MHRKNKLPMFAFCALVVVSMQANAAPNTMEIMKIPGNTSPASESLKTKSFREWKSEKVHDALTRVTSTKTKIQLAKSKDPNLVRRKAGLEATSGVNSENLESQLQQDQSILEMAKDLSVTDYFVGYLTKIQDKKAAFNEVAGKLTSEEVAELMTAYANSVFGTHNSELAPSATDLSSDRVK